MSTVSNDEYWYPCGVACCAGELVTLISTNGGDTWQTHRTFVRGATGTAFVGDSAQLASLSDSSLETDSTHTLSYTLVDSSGVARGTTAGNYQKLLHDADSESIFTQTRGVEMTWSLSESCNCSFMAGTNDLLVLMVLWPDQH
jgi:hypothetical protein